MLTIKGKIVKIFDEKHISEKFNTREFVIETDEQYPQKVLLNLINRNCDLIIGKHPGDSVECFFNVRGREWINPQGEAKYFNSIEVWKILNANAE